ncbi:MAG: Uma2 family endonuclease [Candidatus Bipolaricaulota bacterium]|nr:Uma2 family endonuclease [Candidatus Bipolaricaulota bacterium]MCS7274803.1 Uma2 family endonuclease [Candidatus Bipolaricaulota bacterium]
MAAKRKPSESALAVTELFPPQGQWTERDYFALPDTNRYLELSEGRLIMPPHPTYSHQDALKRLFLHMNAFVEKNQLGVVQVAPLPVRLWPGKIREPDIFFISKEHADRIGEQACGVPDLVVEVLSPATRETDRSEKFFEYAKAGVQEYWLVDPEKRSIEVYTLRGQAYEPFSLSGAQACSKLLEGFCVKPHEIFTGA